MGMADGHNYDQGIDTSSLIASECQDKVSSAETQVLLESPCWLRAP